MALRPEEEVDDGYTRESFERAEEDTGDEDDGSLVNNSELDEDEERDWSRAQSYYALDSSCQYEPFAKREYIRDFIASGEALGEYEDLLVAVRRYNYELNRLELAPNGDDYNNLLDIVLKGTLNLLPTPEGR